MALTSCFSSAHMLYFLYEEIIGNEILLIIVRERKIQCKQLGVVNGSNGPQLKYVECLQG